MRHSRPLGILAIDPDLDRVREVRADLHETGAELLVHDVEVVAGHPPLGLGEGELRQVHGPGAALVGRPHRLELLRHADRGHPAPSRGGQPVLVGPHHVDLPVVLAEAHHRDVAGGGEPGHCPAEPVADLLEDRRRGHRLAQMLGQERDHLPTHLQVRHIAVEVDAVQALDVQPHVPIQQVVDRHHGSHHRTPPRPISMAPSLAVNDHARHDLQQPSTSAVRGEASLDE